MDLNLTESLFARRILNQEKLSAYGFRAEQACYVYETVLRDSGFFMIVTVTGEGGVTAAVVDPALNEPYTLHLFEGASGSFVGAVRAEYERVLTEIAERCFEPDVFHSGLAKKLIVYLRDRYGDAPEFLWEKFPDNAIFRRSDNRKWYAALLTVSKRKFGFSADEPVEVVDFRVLPETSASLVDHKVYFPGYHMNKTYWCTVFLDGSVPFEEICRRVDESYLLAKKG